MCPKEHHLNKLVNHVCYEYLFLKRHWQRHICLDANDKLHYIAFNVAIKQEY
jgi:hypothetical protein